MSAAPDPIADAPIPVVVTEGRRLFRESLEAALVERGFVLAHDPTASDAVAVVGAQNDAPASARVVRLSEATSLSRLGELIHAAGTAHGISLSPTSAGRMDRRRLTRRETQVLHAVSRGDSARVIASAFGISVRTVEQHKRSAMTKLEAHTQAHAVARSVQMGILPA